jgi:hypothetical protein
MVYGCYVPLSSHFHLLRKVHFRACVGHLLGCCTVSYSFLFLFLTVSFLDRGSSAWLFSLLETPMAVVTITGLVCDPFSFSWFHHALKCLSLESMACYTFGFVYSCLTALNALHGCRLWHCCSCSFLVHCTVLCLQWEHHNETTFCRCGSCSLSLSMVSSCSLRCVSAAQSHTSTSCIPHNSVYTEQAKISKSGSLVTMTIQKSCDVMRLHISSVTTLNILATPMNYL